MDHINEETKRVPRLFSCYNVNVVLPEDVVAYRGEIVLYAYQWEAGGRILTAEAHIVLIDDGSAHPQLLPNVDSGSPSGFCHGYGGAGPHALALSLLAHHLGEQPKKNAPYGGLPTAHLMHNDLVHDHISRWPMQEGWALPAADLAGWVRRWQRGHAALLVQRAQIVEEEWAFECAMDALALADEERAGAQAAGQEE